MSNSSESNSQSEDFLAGSIVSSICLLGTVLMGSAILGCLSIPSMKSPFGTLTINQNLAEMIACISCFYVFFFGFTLRIKTVIEYSYLVGGITVIMLHIILISFLLISLNRLCAIGLPMAYKIVFGKKFLKWILVANWLFPLTCSLYLLIIRDCAFVMYHYGWYFDELPNESCGPYFLIYRVYVQNLLTLATFSTDLGTLSLLILLRKRVFLSADSRRRELNFARQVLVQGFVFLMYGVWYGNGRHLMPGMAENWKIFWTTSFSVNMLHVFNPIIVFICNLEFRKWLVGTLKRKDTVGTLSSSVVNTN